MKHLIIGVLCLLSGTLCARAQFTIEAGLPAWKLEGRTLLSAPAEGLWSIATDWENDWPTRWIHASPTTQRQSGEWTLLGTTLRLPEGEMVLRDAYRVLPNGLTQCVRRYQWNGPDTLRRATLSVRLWLEGDSLQPFLPGILYYGNPNGARVNPNIIPVYRAQQGDFALFEDHRYPHPLPCWNRPRAVMPQPSTPRLRPCAEPSWTTSGGRWGSKTTARARNSSCCRAPSATTGNTPWPKPCSFRPCPTRTPT